VPTYEFQCKKCDHVFDVFQALNSTNDHNCTECNSSDVRRLISRVQARFGKDFYEEEYKRGAFDT